MAKTRLTISNIKLIAISVLVGILINPVLFILVVFADLFREGFDSSKPGVILLDRTPFAWFYFWSCIFLTDHTNFEAAISLAVITNTILYFSLSYLLLRKIFTQPSLQ
jgi:hypothetical protein